MSNASKKVVEHLRLRAKSERTCESYSAWIEAFEKYHRRNAEEMGVAEARAYLLHLAEKGRTASTRNQCACALRYLYGTTLGRLEVAREVVGPARIEKRLPDVLTVGEVEQVLVLLRSIKHRCMAMLAYGAGLRLTEIFRLQVTDIDSARMVIHVRDAKGKKDRLVMLPASLLKALREYWVSYRPERPYLFPGCDPRRHADVTILQRVLRTAQLEAGLKKRVSPHILRHSFATHLLDQGTDVRVIQQLLGHSDLSTTMRYTRVTGEHIGATRSPLDVLAGESRPLAKTRGRPRGLKESLLR